MTDVTSRYLAPGIVLDNKYTIVRHLASGGFGNTYLAKTRIGDKVAIKELFLSSMCFRSDTTQIVDVTVKENQAIYESQKQKFLREARRIHQLSQHSNIVKILDLFEGNGTAYYVMDYIEGKSLAQINKPISEKLVLRYLRQILSALEYAHSQGILHLDIKPSNIMVDNQGNVFLIDFGASKQIDLDSDNNSLLSTTSFAYTPGYAPLELTSRNKSKVGTHSDIYSLGATLYNMLTGEIPPSPDEILEDGIPNLEKFSPQIKRVIEPSLKVTIKGRISSVRELSLLLEDKGKEEIESPDVGEEKTSISDAISKGDEYYNVGNYSEAVKWYLKAAEQGHAKAQNNLGNCYYHGQGVSQNYSEAAKWYRKSADQGLARAQNNLGNCHYHGQGVKQSYTEAVKWYRKSAEQGNAYAQNNLGNCYSQGLGVKQSYTEAVEWYLKAAVQGNADAQYTLGLYYANGQGVTRSYAEALKWYLKAADQGQVKAQVNLGYCYKKGYGVKKNDLEALKWYRKAAEQGDADAQWNLGWCYYEGQGVTRNYIEAVKWYLKAAEQGHAKAQCNFGVCYRNGEGVTQNNTEAVKWYTKAAEQGYAYAQYNLALCYRNGEGITQNNTEAVKWYAKAAEQGHAKAQYNLGVCYDNGIGVVQNNTEAVKWYIKAAEQGHAKAQYNLGMCYEYGDGVAKSNTEAERWYRKAAEQGHAGAQEALKRNKKWYHKIIDVFKPY